MLYAGNVATVGSMDDTRTLEEAMPLWLVEFLLFNRAPQMPIIKLGFVLLPWVGKIEGVETEVLPELLNM